MARTPHIEHVPAPYVLPEQPGKTIGGIRNIEDIGKKLNDRFYDIREWGTVGTDDDSALINQAIADAGAAKVPLLIPATPNGLTIGAPLDINRGLDMFGSGPLDGAGCSRIKLADGANCSMVRTPMGVSGDIADATHYMSLRNLWFDANGQNQTVPNIALNIPGNYVGGFYDHLVVQRSYGPAINLEICDLDIGTLWLLDTIVPDPDEAAMLVGYRDGLTTTPGSKLRISSLYLEYTANDQGYDHNDLLADPGKRGPGIRVENCEDLHLDTCHFETNQYDIIVEPGLWQAHLTNCSSLNTEDVIYFKAAPRQFTIDGLTNNGGGPVRFIKSDVPEIPEKLQDPSAGKMVQWVYADGVDPGLQVFSDAGRAIEGRSYAGISMFARSSSATNNQPTRVVQERPGGGGGDLDQWWDVSGVVLLSLSRLGRLQAVQAGSGGDVYGIRLTGDASNRTALRDTGLHFGDGTNAADVRVMRHAANVGGLAAGDSWRLDGTWNGGHLEMGGYHIWVDGSGLLRKKNGAPSSATDGTVVGTET